ncbi:hypothetical protein P175DRAFT_0442089 [Aspergillus ochraceoroseus IBT 24754]|nr:uncharacterized protein P175DRAFT_0442089 [Aspergillus ochraceoroseus IBT 24754]PTU18474.1 hypothetical protein P175DRAFT_0442089 [Aspergillus ochraceoroseus IBT 24754]
MLKDLNFNPLRSWESFQKFWFARFWHFFGEKFKFLFAPDIEALLPQAHGVVLEVGSGSGDWMYLFAPERNRNVTKLLLLEPNREFHETLRTRAEQLGLKDRCEVLDGGVEDLQRLGIEPGTIDTISTVHVLCSVSAPEVLITKLYECLKPGGDWVVYEHVKIDGGKFLPRAFQMIVDRVWPVFLDGCTITRDTEHLLRTTGKWESVELRPGVNQGQFSQLPHIRGVLVKAKQSGKEM